MITIKDKDDAISHINNLFPIGQDPEWDRVWLETIHDFGVQNLPTALLAIMAQKMAVAQGSVCIINLQQTNEPKEDVDARVKLYMSKIEK